MDYKSFEERRDEMRKEFDDDVRRIGKLVLAALAVGTVVVIGLLSLAAYVVLKLV